MKIKDKLNMIKQVSARNDARVKDWQEKVPKGELVKMYEVNLLAVNRRSVYTLRLCKSKDFKYGNETCVIVLRDGEVEEVLDTRYSPCVVDNFKAWCDGYMSSKFNSVYRPEVREIIEEIK